MSSTTPEEHTVVREAQARTKSEAYMKCITECFDQNLQITGDNITVDSEKSIECQKGKVRNMYSSKETDHTLVLLTTDRQSGFDRQLAIVPFKGAVLNLCSQYWFEQTADLIPNHFLQRPHSNMTLGKKCTPFSIEFVVRGYLTGSTDTSIWKHYSGGCRLYCGHALPDGLKKNVKLPGGNICTPTTKEEDHDRPISAEAIVKEGWMSKEDFDVCETAALAIFRRGQELAAQRGMILVDTKYEFGRSGDGKICLIDEVHTPDSSRWWLSSTYEASISAGEEPANISKEFLRLWYRDNCNPYEDKEIPTAPRDLVIELSRRYICLYEIISGQRFDFDVASNDLGAIIIKALAD